MKHLPPCLFLATLLLPELAFACPGCVSTQEKNRVAYLVTTALLSVVPLVSIGALAWWLRARVASMDRESQRPSETPFTSAT